jgi:2-oxo-3-hexenedioate decarboxylase/2-keto-4-pentenoate hydratase
LDEETAPRNADEAYAVQEAFQDIMSQTRGPVTGYKIAYTTATMRDTAGVSEPAAGVILAKNVYYSPATLQIADYLRLGIECEVAARLGNDLPASGAPYNRDQINEAVDAIIPAFEVIDGRGSEIQDREARLIAAIATNISGAGVVLGSPVADWRKVDLAASRGSMTINSELVGEGRGSDVMGHPLEPLVWLANMLAKRGKGLTAGMVVITGSIVTPKFLDTGDVATVVIEGIGEASLKVA